MRRSGPNEEAAPEPVNAGSESIISNSAIILLIPSKAKKGFGSEQSIKTIRARKSGLLLLLSIHLFSDKSHLKGSPMKITGILCVILSSCLFGLMPVAAKIIYANGGNPYFLSFLRFFLALLPLWLLDLPERWRDNRRLNKTAVKRLLPLSIGMGATPVLLFLSYHYISSGLSSTLHFIYPMVVLAICSLFYREKITRMQALCCGLCMAGILLLYTRVNTIHVLGVMAALLSGVTYGFYIAYLSKSGLQEILRPLQLTFWLQAISSGMLFILNLCAGTIACSMNASAWGLSLLFAAGVTLATWLFMLGSRQCGPQAAAMLSTFEPVTSVVIGAAFLHETLTPRALFGTVCILISVLLIAWRPKPAKKQAP